MLHQNVYSNKSCDIFYVKENQYLWIKWSGFPRSIEFREACIKAIELMKEYHTGKLLTDNRNAKVFSVEDQKWLNSEWLKLAVDAGYYCSATIINDDIFVKTAINNIINKRDQKEIKSKLFIQEQEAIEWLLSV